MDTIPALPGSGKTEPPRLWPHLTALLLILAETAWLSPWFVLVMGRGTDASTLTVYLALGTVFLGLYLLARLLDTLQLLIGIERGVLIGAVLLAAFLLQRILFNPQPDPAAAGSGAGGYSILLALMLVVWLAWRAIRLARTLLGPLAVWSRVRLGLGMLTAYIIVFTLVEMQSPSFLPFLIFLTCVLLAMVAARITFIQIAYGSENNPFDRRWLLATLASVGGVVLVAALAGSLVTGALAALLGETSDVMTSILRAILFVVAAPFILLSYLLEPFFGNLRFQMDAVQPTEAPQVQPPEIAPYPPELEPLAETPLVSALPPWLIPSILVAIALIVLLIAFRRMRTRVRRGRRQGETEQEDLLSGGDLLSLLKNNLRGRMQEAADALLSRLRPASRILAAARIRQIYTQLMDLAGDLKQPRPEGKTPLEFVPVLVRLFPGEQREVELVTHAYVKVRYGEYPETREEIDALEAAWQRISEQGKRLKAEQQAAHLAAARSADENGSD
jgi:hypothetical protein